MAFAKRNCAALLEKFNADSQMRDSAQADSVCAYRTSNLSEKRAVNHKQWQIACALTGQATALMT